MENSIDSIFSSLQDFVKRHMADLHGGVDLEMLALDYALEEFIKETDLTDPSSMKKALINLYFIGKISQKAEDE